MNPPCHRQGGGVQLRLKLLLLFPLGFLLLSFVNCWLLHEETRGEWKHFFPWKKCSRCPDAVEMQLTHTALAQILQPVGVTRSIRRENFFFFFKRNVRQLNFFWFKIFRWFCVVPWGGSVYFFFVVEKFHHVAAVSSRMTRDIRSCSWLAFIFVAVHFFKFG